MSASTHEVAEPLSTSERSRTDPSATKVERANYTGIWIRGRGGEWESYEGRLLSKTKAQEIIDSNSLGTWQCGVVITKDVGGDEQHSCVPFLRVLERCKIANEFFATGEISNDNVYHTHFLVKSTSRADSVRRSIITHSADSGFSFDVCKLAGCRFWYGMFAYMCKNPLAVYSSNEKLAALAKWVIEEGKAIKYLDKQKRGGAKEVVCVVNDIIEENDCKTVEDIFKAGKDRLIPFLHLSSLRGVMENCLQFQLSEELEWDPKSFKWAPYPSSVIIHRVLEHQNIDLEEFDEIFWKWICRENGKKNTMVFLGPSNTGKTTFIRGLTQLVPSGCMVNTSSCFFAEGIAGKQLGVWEEPLLLSENAEAFKVISEGVPTMLPQKFKKPYRHEGCPLIITTNHHIWRFCEQEREAISNRCVFWYFYSLMPSTDGVCSADCIKYYRAKRWCAKSRLNWRPTSRNFDREPSLSGIRQDRREGVKLSGGLCGRWWCGSDNRGPCNYCYGSRFKCSQSRGSGSSSSSSTSGDRGSCSEYKARSPRDGISVWECNEHPFVRARKRTRVSAEGVSGPIRSPIGGGGSDELGWGGDRETIGGDRVAVDKPEEISCGGGRSGSTEGSWPEPETETQQTCSCIIEPDKYDWQAYLCYLANKYD